MKLMWSEYLQDDIIIDDNGTHTVQQWLQARKEHYKRVYGMTAKVRA